MTGSRKKYGVIVGFPYYGRYLADLINERSETWRLEYRGESYAARLRSLLEMKRCDAVISFGGPAPDHFAGSGRPNFAVAGNIDRGTLARVRNQPGRKTGGIGMARSRSVARIPAVGFSIGSAGK